MRDEFLWGETLPARQSHPPPRGWLARRPVVQGTEPTRNDCLCSAAGGGAAIDYRKYRKRIVYSMLKIHWLPVGSKMEKAACPGHLFGKSRSVSSSMRGRDCAPAFWGLRLPGCGKAGQNRRGWGKFVPAKL